MAQIQISYFSCHFYVVNVILLSVLEFWTNFDTKKFLFIFYDSFFKAMTFSECPEAVQEISDRLLCMFEIWLLLHALREKWICIFYNILLLQPFENPRIGPRTTNDFIDNRGPIT